MPELDFQVESAAPVPYAASPQLGFAVRVSQAPAHGGLVEIHSVNLQCQIRLEPGRRKYSPEEQEKLVELYGEPKRWGQTVRSTLWANVMATARGFTESTLVNLLVPCTYDFNVAQTKYFHALADGEVPLCLLFSGTIFFADAEGSLRIEQISWEKEAHFRLPVRVWKELMEMYYPNSQWLNLRRDVFDALDEFRIRSRAGTWERTIEKLLDTAAEEVTP